ncbi:MAG: diguanylate cyclase [Campylobacterota bacterium]|nr:diguanylate cyclase [Campylobacterota bacterium]
MKKKELEVLKLYEIPIDTLSMNVAVYRKLNDDFIIVDFNKSAQITEDLNKEDIVGKQLTKIFPQVKEFGLFDVLEDVYKSGGHEVFDLKFYEDNRISGWRKNEVIKLPNGDVMAIYEDLTKEKQYEESLEKLNNFIDNSQTIVFFWKPQKHWPVEYVSGNISDWGYSKEDFLSQKLYYEDIIYHEDIQMVRDEVEQFTKNGNEKFAQTYRIVTAEKSIRWIDDRTIIERDSKGKTIKYLGTLVDITDRKEIELKLKESEEYFRGVAECSLMGIFIYTDCFVYANQALCDMAGYSYEEFMKIRPWELTKEPYRSAMKKAMLKRVAGERFPKNYNDIEFTIKNGDVRTTRIMTETIKYKGGYAGLGTLVDITDITQTKRKLKMLAQAVEQTDELIMITDSKGIVTYVNDAYVAHSGYRHSELIGKSPNVVKSDKHNHHFFKELWETVLAGKTYTNTITNRKKDNQLYYEDVTITPIFNDNNVIVNFISTGRDITERIKMEEKLQLLATTDSLTGIYNRYRGHEILDVEVDKAYRYGDSLAVLMFDIDYFKKVNDNHGHDVGDYVLKRLTALVSKHMRKSDAFIRWGGEEFIIISAHLDKKKAIDFAQKLRIAIASYKFDLDMKITVSFGVTVFKTNDTKERILKRVDDALFEAKDSGRNCMRYL